MAPPPCSSSETTTSATPQRWCLAGHIQQLVIARAISGMRGALTAMELLEEAAGAETAALRPARAIVGGHLGACQALASAFDLGVDIGHRLASVEGGAAGGQVTPSGIDRY